MRRTVELRTLVVVVLALVVGGAHVRRLQCSTRAVNGCRSRRRAGAGSAGRWTFTLQTLADGRAFRTLNIVDDVTRECVASRWLPAQFSRRAKD